MAVLKCIHIHIRKLLPQKANVHCLINSIRLQFTFKGWWLSRFFFHTPKPMAIIIYLHLFSMQIQNIVANLCMKLFPCTDHELNSNFINVDVDVDCYAFTIFTHTFVSTVCQWNRNGTDSGRMWWCFLHILLIKLNNGERWTIINKRKKNKSYSAIVYEMYEQYENACFERIDLSYRLNGNVCFVLIC